MSTKPRFIAEVSSNHNQDLKRALSFIDTAAAIGCAGVKFQLFKTETLFAPSILQTSAIHRARKKWELPQSYLPHLKKRCVEMGIDFGCTPFDLSAVDTLTPYVDFFKIASYELPYRPLFDAVSQTGIPVAFSTGIATLNEVDRAVAWLEAGGATYQIYHCVSSYPTPIEACNLSAIETLKDRYRCPVGWSDHSASPAVIYRAAGHFSADMIEFHLDLDGTGVEYPLGHCWLPDQIAPIIKAINTDLIDTGSSLADGSGEKQFDASEQTERIWRADPSDGLRPFKSIRPL